MKGRRNLLITTIGKFDCIPSWISEDRNFDIALIYYPENVDDKTRAQLSKFADFVFFESGFKYSILKSVLEKNSFLLEYDYFWMPDHDVLFKKGNVSLLFDYMKRYNLNLGQPSLVNKNRSWKILVNKPLYELRYINLVEVMCPAFSRNALDVCLKTFSWSLSGWGLGLLWGKLIGNNIAVIDKLIVEHTQKMDVSGGELYKKLLLVSGKSPEEERDFLVNKYGLDTSIVHRKKVLDPNSIIGKVIKLFR